MYTYIYRAFLSTQKSTIIHYLISTEEGSEHFKAAKRI